MKFRHNNHIKQGLLLFLLLLLPAVLGGCSGEDEESAYHIEYLNKDKSRIIEEPYEPMAEDTEGMILEFLRVLSSDSENMECRKPIPSDVEVVNHTLEGVLLSLYFDEDYLKMSPAEEVLCRAAVVRTMVQITGVECVFFYVADAPLVDATGQVIGGMTRESFIQNPGEQINTIQNTDLTLYFSNENGDGLVMETRTDVYYSSNISIEKLIMEQLLSGPKVQGAKAALPAGTRLMAVTMVEGVCYVSLDETFRNHDYKVNEAIVIYSIVNSLTEVPGIDRVQISINGDTSGVYRDSFLLEEMYERNLDYMAVEDETVTEEPTEGE